MAYPADLSGTANAKVKLIAACLQQKFLNFYFSERTQKAHFGPLLGITAEPFHRYLREIPTRYLLFDSHKMLCFGSQPDMG